MIKRILLTFHFLTIIPFRDTGKVTDREAGSTTGFFPLVGVFEGAVLVILAALLLKLLPAEPANGLLVLTMIIINGGLHLDGVADTFDAIALRGERDRKLEVMKDSTIGPFGVIAIVMVLLMKYVLLNALYFNSELRLYYSGIFLMAVLSRWSMVPVIFHCRSAKTDGLGKVFAEHTGQKELLTATALTVLITAATAGLVLHVPVIAFHLMFVMPVLYMAGIIAVWFFKRRFGGMTGDTFGAFYEFAVLLFLMMRVIWSQRSI